LGAVFSVILFRIIVISFMYQTTENEEFFKTYARLLATSLAAAINSVVIEAGGMIFQVIEKLEIEIQKVKAWKKAKYFFSSGPYLLLTRDP